MSARSACARQGGRRVLAAIAAVTVLLMAGALPAWASVGIGVQSNPVRLAGKARPGGHYLLPSVYVVNTGTEAASVAVMVERVSRGEGITIPAAWVSVVGPTLQLAPTQSGRLNLRLTIPETAAAGTYFSDLVVTAKVPLKSGPNFGASAATDLEFTIGDGAGQSGRSGVSLLLWGVGGGIVLVVLAGALLWRAGVRIRVDRNPDPVKPE